MDVLVESDAIKICNVCEISKLVAEFPKRDGVPRSKCKSCVNEYKRNWHLSNPGKSSAYGKKFRDANPEKMKIFRDSWRFNNAEKARSIELAWRTANAEKVKRRKTLRYAANDEVRAMHRRWSSVRRVFKTGATPAWADEFIISEIYSLAALRTKVTGTIWHVDHIVPLQSKIVCGLHCEKNLQVITAKENLSKNNLHWPDMP